MTGLSDLEQTQGTINQLGAEAAMGTKDPVTGKLRSGKQKRKVDGILQPRERQALNRTPGTVMDSPMGDGSLADSIVERPRKRRPASATAGGLTY